jgi:hypothetical protein
MKTDKSFIITREKHLDHMVKVVPFIVFCYAVQCFAIVNLGATGLATTCLTVLGGLLSIMISAFITYDLKHKVTFEENELKIDLLFRHHSIKYKEIYNIEINEPGQSFSNLSFRTKNGKHTFYFIDDAEKIKSFIESKQLIELQAA